MDVASAHLADDFARARGAVDGAMGGMIMMVDVDGSLVIGTSADERHLTGTVAGAGDEDAVRENSLSQSMARAEAEAILRQREGDDLSPGCARASRAEGSQKTQRGESASPEASGKPARFGKEEEVDRWAALMSPRDWRDTHGNALGEMGI